MKEKHFCRTIIKKKTYSNFKFKCLTETFNPVSKLNLNMIDQASKVKKKKKREGNVLIIQTTEYE